MSEYFDRLESELRAAVPRAATPPRLRRLRRLRQPRRVRPMRPLGQRRRVTPGGLAGAFGVAVALGIAALAVALLGHTRHIRHAPLPPPASSGPALARNPVPTLSQLLGNFAVLRRPQTAADRSWQPGCGCGRAVRELPRLTRLAQRLAGGVRVFLTVEQFRSGGQLNQAAGSYSLAINIVDARNDVRGTNFGPNDNYTVLPLPMPAPPGSPSTTRWTSIVPDGVSKVHWTFACVPQHCAAGSLTVVVAPRHNLAVATVPDTGQCTSASTGTCRQPVAATWYAGNGHVVVTFGGRAGDRSLTTPPFVNPSLTPARPPQTSALLGGDGILAVHFGASPAAVLAGLRPAIGRPTTGYSRGGSCDLDHRMIWAAGARSRPASTLVLYFRHLRFAGYQYGDVRLTTPLRAHQRVPLVTATTGLGVGDTVARGRRLYGTALTVSAAQGGSWAVRTTSGRLSGFASGWGPHDRVASIDAGDVGCPALSP